MIQPATKTILIDGMILAYRNYSSLSFLRNSKGESTGMRFGFLRSVCSIKKALNLHANVVIFWDTPGPIVKAEGFDEYKANRPSKKIQWEMSGEPKEATDVSLAKEPSLQELFNGLEPLRELLSLTGWYQSYAAGYEADDLIAGALLTVDKPAVIISSDRDLNQLVYGDVKQWSGKSKDHLVDYDQVVRHWGIQPNQISLFKAFIGDASDNIKPMGDKVLRELFRGFLHDHPEVSAWQHVMEQQFFQHDAEWYAQLAKRQHLMQTWVPTQIGFKAGKSDRIALLKAFDELESKALPKSIDHML